MVPVGIFSPKYTFQTPQATGRHQEGGSPLLSPLSAVTQSPQRPHLTDGETESEVKFWLEETQP